MAQNRGKSVLIPWEIFYLLFEEHIGDGITDAQHNQLCEFFRDKSRRLIAHEDYIPKNRAERAKETDTDTD